MTIASIEQALRKASQSQPASLTTISVGTPQERYGQLRGLHNKPAAMVRLSLTDIVPRIEETTTRAVAQKAGQSESLALAIFRASRIAQAGARIIPVELSPEPGSPTSLWRRAGGFTLMRGASFAEGDDSAPLQVQPLPAVTEDIDLDQMGQYGARFEIDRRRQKDTPPGELDAQIVAGIAFGLAELIDRVALARIAAEVEAAAGLGAATEFSLAAAAGAGLRFDELSALVGSGGAGAQVENGRLRVAGVPAELTREHEGTFVGAFSRVGVAVMDDVRVLVERTSLSGVMAITVWADMLALMPAGQEFVWSAS